MGQQWYIKRLDRISGPVSTAGLRQQITDGRLTPDHLVSLNRERWIKASRVKGLDFPASGQPRSIDSNKAYRRPEKDR